MQMHNPKPQTIFLQILEFPDGHRWHCVPQIFKFLSQSLHHQHHKLFNFHTKVVMSMKPMAFSRMINILSSDQHPVSHVSSPFWHGHISIAEHGTFETKRTTKAETTPGSIPAFQPLFTVFWIQRLKILEALRLLATKQHGRVASSSVHPTWVNPQGKTQEWRWRGRSVDASVRRCKWTEAREKMCLRFVRIFEQFRASR